MRYKTCVKCGSIMVYDRGWTCEPCLTEVVNIKRKMMEDGIGRIVYLDKEEGERDVLDTVSSGEIRRA